MASEVFQRNWIRKKMPNSAPQTPGQIEVQEFLQTSVLRKRLLPRAVLVGIASGIIAVCFRIGLQFCEDARLWIVTHAPGSPVLSFLTIFLIGTAGTFLAIKIGRIDPHSGGSGIPQMKAVLEGHLTMNWFRVLWVKFLGSLVALGSGLALGREGPTVQMGGAIGQGIATFTKSNKRETRALSAAGAGAGLAAAFNAPLAGVTFVLEELQRDFQPIVFVATLLCAAVATVISRLVSGQFPVFAVPHITPPSLTTLPLFAIVGLVGGALGVLFNKVLLSFQVPLAKLREKSPLMLAALIGVLIAAAAQFSTSLVGGGHALSEQAINGKLSLFVAIAFLVVRFFLIHVCYGTGVPGGIFAPLLSLGALVGLISFRLAGVAHMQGAITVEACAVAGMCAMFSGVVRAPLTGVILIGEMTGSYDLLLPLLVTAFSAYAIAEAMRSTPIYESLLQRFAMSNDIHLEDEERQFVEMEIRPDSPLAGARLRDVALPSGTLVVLCSRAGKEVIPNGNTILGGGMKISVVTTSRQALYELQQMANATTV